VLGVEDYLQNPDKQAKVHDLEKQIEQMVYKLYDLTSADIVIVEGRSCNGNKTRQAADKQLKAIEALPGAILRGVFDFEKSFKNRTVKRAKDIDIYLASIDDVVKMKEFSGRSQDLSDIEMLNKVRKYLEEKNG
jgi:hypothetical protein